MWNFIQNFHLFCGSFVQLFSWKVAVLWPWNLDRNCDRNTSIWTNHHILIEHVFFYRLAIIGVTTMDIYRNWLYYICLPIPIFRRDGEKLHLEFDWEKFKSWQFVVHASGPSQAWTVVCLPIFIFWLDSGKLDSEFDWEKFQVLTVCTPHQWTFTSMDWLFTNIYSPVALCLKLDLEFDWEVSSFDSLHSLPGNLHKNGLFVCQCLKIWFGVWLRQVSRFDSLHFLPVDLHKHGLFVCQC